MDDLQRRRLLVLIAVTIEKLIEIRRREMESTQTDLHNSPQTCDD